MKKNMKKKLYIKPLTELTQVEKSPFVMTSIGGEHNPVEDGGIVGGEGKSFFSWTFQNREGIEPNTLNKSWDD